MKTFLISTPVMCTRCLKYYSWPVEFPQRSRIVCSSCLTTEVKELDERRDFFFIVVGAILAFFFLASLFLAWAFT